MTLFQAVIYSFDTVRDSTIRAPLKIKFALMEMLVTSITSNLSFGIK